MKVFKIILSENSTDTNRISSIKFSFVRRYIKTFQIRPTCVVGVKICGKSKPPINWLGKFIFEEFQYQNGVLKCNLIMEFKDITILKERFSI